jgi:hypothetical protein
MNGEREDLSTIRRISPNYPMHLHNDLIRVHVKTSEIPVAGIKRRSRRIPHISALEEIDESRFRLPFSPSRPSIVLHENKWNHFILEWMSLHEIEDLHQVIVSPIRAVTLGPPRIENLLNKFTCIETQSSMRQASVVNKRSFKQTYSFY